MLLLLTLAIMSCCFTSSLVDANEAEGEAPHRSIALSKSLRLTLPDGSANVTAVDLAAINTIKKFAVTSTILLNRFKNVIVKPDVPLIKRGAWQLGLTDYASDVLWYGPLSVGTPAQIFQVDFDTGSSNFVLVRDTCTGQYCATSTDGTIRKEYKVGSSSTAVVSNSRFSASYTGGTVPTSGSIVFDTVRFGRLTAKSAAICAADTVGGSIAGLPVDGLVGMAYPALSSGGTVSLPFTLARTKAIPTNVFAFKLSSIAGQSMLDMGYINNSRFSGTPFYYPVALDPDYLQLTYYQIANSVTNVNGIPVPATLSHYTIDSGSTLIMASVAASNAFWSMVPGSQSYPPNPQFHIFPCTTKLVVSLSFGGSVRQHAMAANDFNLGYIDHPNGNCLGAIIGANLGLGSRMIIGDVFMKNWYTIFNPASNTVGFAPLV